MTKLKLSNSQRDLYLQCGKKYYFRYIKKMRTRAKGSALFFGSAFDKATGDLLESKDLAKARISFTEAWMNQESNYNCKFAKADYVEKILNGDDIAKLTACVDSLNHSKALQDYKEHGNILKVVSDIKKMSDNTFLRDLTKEEAQYLHFANVLSMNRKGLLMLESFNTYILPHITNVVGTQVKIAITHPLGHEITGYIDLLCNMAGYKLPNGRVLEPDDLVVADVKSAGAMYWDKLDDLTGSPQLDTYLSSPEVQSIKTTNLIAYYATAKQISTLEESFCKSCGNKKNSSHKTCNAEHNGKRCGGEWDLKQTHYVDSKIVIGERNIDDAGLILEDYENVLTGIQHGVFARNRDACDNYGQICEFKSICGKCLTPALADAKVEEWIKENGE